MTKSRNLSLRWGVILGGVSVVWALILFVMDMHDSQDWLLQVVALVISIVVIVLGILEFRKLSGFLTIAQSVNIAIIISLVSTVIYIIYYFILTNYMDPGMVDRQIDEVLNKYLVNNPEASDEVLDRIRKGQELGRGPLFFTGTALIVSVISGIVFGLIAGLILKKRLVLKKGNVSEKEGGNISEKENVPEKEGGNV